MLPCWNLTVLCDSCEPCNGEAIVAPVCMRLNRISAYYNFGQNSWLPEGFKQKSHKSGDSQHDGDLNDEKGQCEVDGLITLQKSIRDCISDREARVGGVQWSSHMKDNVFNHRRVFLMENPKVQQRHLNVDVV